MQIEEPGPTVADALSAPQAEIIPFPGRFHAAPVAPVDDARARLESALVALNQALAKQREALQSWRDATADLAAGVAALANRLQTLDTRLGEAVAPAPAVEPPALP